MSSLPERPDLEYLREKAKDLLRQYRACDPAAFFTLRSFLPAALLKSDSELSAMALQLADAQSCVARQHGFASWQKLKEQVEQDQGTRGIRVFDPKHVGTSSSVYANIARLRYEQARPRTPIAFDPSDFDRYVGYYQLLHSSTAFTHIFRVGGRFLEQLSIEKRTGVAPVEFFPESSTKFFATVVASQISFVLDAEQRVTGLIFHQNGYERLWTKVEESVVEAYEAGLDQRIKDNTASPGTEEFLRRYISGCEKGQPNFEDMTPALAESVHGLRSKIARRHQRAGAFKAMIFKGVDRLGMDVYEATFTRGQVEYRIPPLNADGKVVSIAPREIP